MKVDLRVVAAVALLWLSLGQMDGCRLTDVLPIPGPAKLEGQAWLIVVEESQERTPSLAAVMRDRDWQSKIAASDVEWRVYDDDSDEGARYASLLDGVPGYLIADSEGKVYGSGSLPGEFTSEFFNAALREVGR